MCRERGTPLEVRQLAMLATPLESSAAPAEPIVTMPQVPSAKALGKRRLDDGAPDPPHDAPTSQVARPPAAPVEAVKKQERRVTRSSLGGASTADREASEADNERECRLPALVWPR